MSRVAWAVLLAGLGGVVAMGCASRRHIDIEFTSAMTSDVDAIQRVDVQVFDGGKCVCSQLGTAGCADGDAISTLSFGPTSGDRTGGGFPDGALVVKVAAFDSAQSPVKLRIDCWCVPDRSDQALIFPLGTPTSVAGAGCP